MSQESVKAALMQSIAAIGANAGSAKVVFRAETQLEEDVRCSAKVRNFPSIAIDEPPELGGADSAPNPVELLLVALGTCQEIMYSAYASVMGIKLDSVKVNLRGYLDLRGLFGLDPSVAPGYHKIVFDTQIESAADTEILKTLISTVESHCPVLDCMVRAIEVNGSVSVNGKRMETEAIAA